ncbi:hypothetical protein DPMN_140242 [Dreissena polymorpha]|uniref:TIR domain-containing protein n=2 Tax=Dreissena polymorpha TaxID=45954 RepID=A0A9D4G7T6_DREPO|nr:hypothetical protein DPMN_140242 [Dreissena polymorpha]
MHPSRSLLDVRISNCYYTHNMSSGYPTATIISTKEDMIYQISFLEKYCASYTPLIISLVAILLVIFNIILASIIHRFRWKIRYWYYVGYNKEIKHKGYSTIESSLRDLIFKYDLYLAYEDDVKEIVFDILKPKLLDLEYTVFTHDDILDGLPLYNVITKSIHASRVVVFVLSNGPRDSLEWKIAAHITNEESNHRQKPMSVALFYNSDSTVGLPEELQLLRRNAFIDYPVNGSEQEITAFWEDFITYIKRN